MRTLPLIVVIVVTTLTACTPSTRERREIDAIAQREFEARHLPGLAVVVLRGDETMFAKGYGEIAGGTPISAATRFQLGSIGKQFLAALVVALAGEGRLSLTAPVAQYLNDFPLLPQLIEVRHLLSHTSGIRELFTLPEAQEGFDNLSRTREELIAAIRKAPVDFAAGSRWSYSNTNYTLLALIVERVTHTPYEEVLAQRFFSPFKLSTISQCPSIQSTPAEARGHERQDNTNVLSPPENMEWIRGDGGICGSAEDLARWTRLLATGRIIPTSQYAQMTSPTALADGGHAEYGFALSLVQPDGRRKIAHNGAMRGFSASAAYYPDDETTVVVLTNRGDVRTEAIERSIARLVIGLPDPDRRERPLSPPQRQRVIGIYDIGAFNVRIADRDGRLWFEMPPPGPTFPMRHVGNGSFVNAADPDASALRFSTLDDPPAELRFYMGAMHWYGRRVNP